MIIDGLISRCSVDLRSLFVAGSSRLYMCCCCCYSWEWLVCSLVMRRPDVSISSLFLTHYSTVLCFFFSFPLCLSSFSLERATGRSLIHAKQAVLGRESKKTREKQRKKRRKKPKEGEKEREKSWHNEHACLCPTSWRVYLYLDERDAWARDRWSSKLSRISCSIALLVDIVEILTLGEKYLSIFSSASLFRFDAQPARCLDSRVQVRANERRRKLPRHRRTPRANRKLFTMCPASLKSRRFLKTSPMAFFQY